MSSDEGYDYAHVKDLAETALRQTAEHAALFKLLHELYENCGKRLDLQSREIELLGKMLASHLGLE